MVLKLAGIILPLVTPFTDPGQDLDEDALRAEVRHLLATSVHGLTVCGSTGEGQTLSLDETVRISEIALEEARGRVPVVTGIIRDSTREVIRYGQALQRVGVDGLQITPVHYLFQPNAVATAASSRSGHHELAASSQYGRAGARSTVGCAGGRSSSRVEPHAWRSAQWK